MFLADDRDFSAHGFYSKLSDGELCAIRCKSCKNYVMPPTSICKSCMSKDLEWVRISKRGRVITFSEIHVSSKEYQARTPYVVAIVETEEGLKLPGIIKDATADNVKIGSSVTIDVDQSSNILRSKYYFVLAEDT